MVNHDLRNEDVMHIGASTVLLEKSVYVEETACVAGKKESEGPLGDTFDIVVEDPMFGEDNWEMAESRLQEKTIDKLLIKSKYNSSDISYIFAGDLLGQLIATSFGVKKYDIPVFGLYSACSTFGEAMALGSFMVSAGGADRVIAEASSHFASAEKQFRYPLGYGTQRPQSSTWTVTGCGAVILSDKPGKVVVKGFTTGRIVDYGVKDSMNMGAAMAPAAADLISTCLSDLDVAVTYFDKIITGDLGEIGSRILTDILMEKGMDISGNHMDCGMLIYDSQTQETKSGGSGCGCSATVFCSYVYKKLCEGRWGRVLFIPTGALLSTVSFNEGQSVPGIAHGVILEHVD